MSGVTIDLPNTGDLREFDAEGKLIIDRGEIFVENDEGVAISLASLLRVGYGADEALGEAMALQEGVPASEARIGLGQVSITVEFHPAD